MIKVPLVGKLYPPIAGLVSGVGSALLTVVFWQALIIAAVTGILAAVGTMIGAVISARIAARATKPAVREELEPVRADLDHVKRSMGLNKREDDPS